MLEKDRKSVLNAAKLAVNAYIEDPCETNAERVRFAWETIKGLEAAPIWRQPSDIWLRSAPAPEDNLTHIIKQALDEARRQGKHKRAQTKWALRAVHEARPDMQPWDALAAVRMAQRP